MRDVGNVNLVHVDICIYFCVHIRFIIIFVFTARKELCCSVFVIVLVHACWSFCCIVEKQ